MMKQGIAVKELKGTFKVCLLILICVCSLSLMHHKHTGPLISQKRMSELLKVELQAVGCSQLGAENRTKVICSSSKCP